MDIKVVTEEDFQKRLAHCNTCASLQCSTTCRHCGCLVEIHAKLAAATCPYPFEPSW